jgi:uroporphyrinogen-III synthase
MSRPWRAQTLIAFSISDVEIHALVAAIGPVVAAELEALEVRVNVTPRDKTFFMKPLVRELAAAFG